MAILKAREFPERWIKWIEVILSTSSSRALINGDATEFFTHCRGLRQGDPLSPMLFDLAVDTLQRMVQVANNQILAQISNRFPEAIIAMQYADDTAIVANGEAQTLRILKILLRLFTKISGLSINFHKSCFVPLNLDDHQKEMAIQILGCQTTSLPLNYLGLPLTINRPGREAYLPLIEKFQQKLEGWKGRLLSRGGRL